MVARNDLAGSYIRQAYQLGELEALWDLLRERGTLTFSPLENGLFSAAAVSQETAYTGYEAVWVRDNVYVAFAHYFDGNADDQERAVSTMRSLARFFHQERAAFERTIKKGGAPDSQMDRPHIRFKGASLEKIAQPWNHAQNDALGYFLWLFCRLILEDAFEPTAEEHNLLSVFPLYFEAIRYWQDEDSGHWEEAPKVEASSIGTVVAGLSALREVLSKWTGEDAFTLIEELIGEGQKAIAQILPSESVQAGKERRYDAALLFLTYPLRVVSTEQSYQIVNDVVENLSGAYGISRYKGDSFWCRDYRDIPEGIRTDVSEKREAWLRERERELRPNEEAQWCVFDPILSAFYGQQYQKRGEKQDLEKQTAHFNRAIAQLTSENCLFGGLKGPELYYLQSGSWIANDSTPLLWTQANLLLAFKWMRRSLTAD